MDNTLGILYSDYRAFSLSSFRLKTMERLIHVYVRNILNPLNFCQAQHAYQIGWSVETVLYDVDSKHRSCP